MKYADKASEGVLQALSALSQKREGESRCPEMFEESPAQPQQSFVLQKIPERLQLFSRASKDDHDVLRDSLVSRMVGAMSKNKSSRD